mmetsp:Transcript_73252/g.152878  ORF Transcript_73252/g.152878 Transcript_73252/m.152878 type:complete len:84 (-) Transcript_73252:233-484(-)
MEDPSAASAVRSSGDFRRISHLNNSKTELILGGLSVVKCLGQPHPFKAAMNGDNPAEVQPMTFTSSQPKRSLTQWSRPDPAAR